ncbi:dihydrofolate reductase [Sinorhizobium sp. BG8]|uniref:dihydrofolate reductase n=1 Tax=Sinorhizobium sp. BG8 TaxID=2613773 RepID=UPI00193DF9F6|nr:dihydrofolate reductase [Sinorhizobium sp. BG8]QRM55909.1 dihydrofolate reductase [Sinorhizobium sp. BG8]
MANPKIVLVVAVARNGIIGRDGDLPWRLPSDLKRFKRVTMGKPIVMGRKTFTSIGRPLPGRPNIVITRDPSFAADGVSVARSLDEALEQAGRSAAELGVDEICIVGGGEIYRQVFAKADVIHVTEVDAEVEGDTRFPDIDTTRFSRVFEEPMERGEKDSHAMHFVTWKRI